jgi:hypothetical protein
LCFLRKYCVKLRFDVASNKLSNFRGSLHIY